MGFFSSFPQVLYVINPDPGAINHADIMTNIFTRVRVLDELKNNSLVYYEYPVQEGDTPEIVADKYYGDPELHWLIIYANDIINVYADWPMDYATHAAYVIAKYGSVPIAQATVHHYEKITTRVDSASGIETVTKSNIDADAYAVLPVSTFNTYNLSNGTTVAETITKASIDCYTFELQVNESKRVIKIIRKEYLPRIKQVFDALMASQDFVNPNG